MNAKKVLYNYVCENEPYIKNVNLQQIEDLFLNNLNQTQKDLYEELKEEICKRNDRRCFYFFCEGLKISIK